MAAKSLLRAMPDNSTAGLPCLNRVICMSGLHNDVTGIAYLGGEKFQSAQYGVPSLWAKRKILSRNAACKSSSG